MKVEFRVEGKTLDELEEAARAECEQMADGRAFTWSIGEVFSSSDRDFPSPIARMSAGYGPRTFSAYVTATFEDKAGTGA